MRVAILLGCIALLLAYSQVQPGTSDPSVRAMQIPATWEAANSALQVPVISVMVGTVLGGIIGAVVSWLFSRQASKELRAAAAQLHLATDRVLRVLEAMQRGVDVETVKGADGEIKALHFKVGPETLRGEMSMTGDLTWQRVYRPFPSD